MTFKRSSLSTFFFVLALSIGFVSVDAPLTIKAQDNALYQSGNGGDAEQETGQSQLSEQNDQVVSGDSSTASGNILLC